MNLKEKSMLLPTLVGRVMPLSLVAVGLMVSTMMLSGCGAENSVAAAPKSPTPVDVAVVQTQKVTDWSSFTGHFDAVERVQLRPRVSGYIDEVRFTEGSDVQRGQVLFVIDPRPYKLQLQFAKAELDGANAELDLARQEQARSDRLLSSGAISKEIYDQRVSLVNQLVAEREAANANYEQAKLNLEYTQVVSPIDGRISRAAFTRGNYVAAGQSVLTSLVSMDPIYVEFASDENSYKNFRALINNGHVPAPASGETPVLIGLAGSDNYPHTARLTFVDHSIAEGTGTIAYRALIPNPDLRFTPGMLARVRIQNSAEYQAALIDDAAIATDQGRKYVLRVDDQGVAQYQPIVIGDLVNGQRVIRNGLQGGETIIVNGLQRVWPGMPVEGNLIEAPSDKLALQL